MKKSYRVPKTIKEYISNFIPATQKKLNELYKIIKETVPQAEETICYGIPTFKLNGNLVHFGAYTSHLSFYPSPSPIKHFKEELANYKTSKGTIQLPLDKPFPRNLIIKIIKFRVKENLSKPKSNVIKL